jgi:molecular chaperone DnaJ
MNRDWVEKDFYKRLGVDKDTPADEIKKAYRKLAQKYHPDTNQGDAKASETFKEVSEAYATLSDADQRKEYDQVRRVAASGGFQGFRGGQPGGFGGGQQVRVENLQDLLGGFGGAGDLFGFGSRSGSGPTRGHDLQTELSINFEDAAHGSTTAVNLRGAATCSRCGGAGNEPGTTVTNCPTCQGRGVVAQNQGVFSFSQPCPQCRGAGKLIETPCTTCRGTGSEDRTREVKLKIPAGITDGATLRLRGKGGPGTNGGPSGDLLVRMRVGASKTFGRKGNNLTLTVPITYTEAALGTRIDVPTLNGGVTVKIPSGTPTGKTFRIRGHGIEPAKGRSGDLMVTVQVAVPTKVSRAEKQLLEELATHETNELRDHLR